MTTAPSLKEIFGPDGVLARHIEGYEYRPSQLAMAEAVHECLVSGQFLCVEAGTGTGKTLAYLIPALLTQERVVISTATRNLQEQLFLKDLPFLRQWLFPRVKATCMKGRQNYLCLRRLEEERSRSWVEDVSFRSWAQRLSDWLARTDSGDRAELEWLSDDDPIWNSVDARSDTCTGQKCKFYSECFVTRMRQRAFESDIVVMNHALLFSNLALERDEIGSALPDFRTLILDEAHEVEETAATHFGKRVSNYQVEDLCRRLERVFENDQVVSVRAQKILEASDQFFALVPETAGRRALDLAATPSSDFVAALAPAYERLLIGLDSLYHHLEATAPKPQEGDALARRLERLIKDLNELVSADDSSNVYWVERRGRGVFFHLSPVEVAPLLTEKLFSRLRAAVLTSATLTTGGDFSYFQSRLGIPQSTDLVLPGEFDYSRQAVLFVPRNLPVPGSGDYVTAALREIRRVLAITDGHAFLLFTSYVQMEHVFRALQQENEFPLFCQGEMPKSSLLEEFKRTPRAVLCATASFWQGVDVKGDALRAVIIDKLPFQVPTEPLVAARIRKLEESGKDSFLAYTVPNAIIALKQGLGRLIRSRQDLGILAVLDSRLWTRNYGQLFLRSLPNCPVTSTIDDVRNFYARAASEGMDGTQPGSRGNLR